MNKYISRQKENKIDKIETERERERDKVEEPGIKA